MRSVRIPILIVLALWALFAATIPTKVVASGNEKIALVDDCDPHADWGPGGCLREEGSVTRAEFGAFLFSPLVPGDPAALRITVGHPSWRIAPGFLAMELGEKLRVKNEGGRGHTFTEVANYGGGFIAGLNGGMAIAAECPAAASAILAPGARAEIGGLSLGNHKFQCCIHPWMRADVKVQPEE